MNPTEHGFKDPIGRPTVDAVVIGAGFAGLYMLHRLRQIGLTARAFEKGSDVGGVWYWNRYPGARCDVESMQYSYSFSQALQQEWRWSERYAPQPEILDYAKHVADRFDLRRDIQFETIVTAAHYDEASGLWDVSTNRGERLSARFCVMATGCLSATRIPDLAGLDAFRGKTYHTGAWPHEPFALNLSKGCEHMPRLRPFDKPRTGQAQPGLTRADLNALMACVRSRHAETHPRKLAA